MAIGDAAAAAGLAVFPASQDLRKGYENDNIRGDELANHKTAGTHAFDKITGIATLPQLPAIPFSKMTGAAAVAQLPAIPFSKMTGQASAAQIPALPASQITAGQFAAARIPAAVTLETINTTTDQGLSVIGNLNVDSLNILDEGVILGTLPVTSSRPPNLYAAQASDGQPVGRLFRSTVNVSSRRYKTDITAADVNPEAVLGIQAKYYRLIELGDDGPQLFGMIAEDLHDAGLPECVIYDDEGRPDGINYAQWGVVVHQVTQWLYALLRDQQNTLEVVLERLARLEKS